MEVIYLPTKKQISKYPNILHLDKKSLPKYPKKIFSKLLPLKKS